MENEAFELFRRIDGPMNFRIIIQPLIAATLGYIDGANDAKTGAPPYFWSVTKSSSEERKMLIKNGWMRVSKVFTIAIILDCVFQYAIDKTLHILPAVLIAVILAILPYLVFRGLINRIKSKARASN